MGFDPISLSLSKNYTAETVKGMGAIKGDKGDTGPQGVAGPAGPDGSPIGTIISYMGTTAPDGYLICDGAEYPISDYPAMADFFQRQFGAVNYFGGDGEITFAVPDLRNLFLRGYHREAEEQLSGEIGEKQEATGSLNNWREGSGAANNYYVLGPYNSGDIPSPYKVQNADKFYHPTARIAGVGYDLRLNNFDLSDFAYYTARPVNMAVLYCIKAVESTAGADSVGWHIYSTDEKVVGKWIDDRDVCEKTYILTVPSGAESAGTWQMLDPSLSSNVVEYIVSYSGSYHINNEVGCIPYTSGGAPRIFFISFSDGLKYNCYVSWKNIKMNVTIRYVKKVTEVQNA